MPHFLRAAPGAKDGTSRGCTHAPHGWAHEQTLNLGDAGLHLVQADAAARFAGPVCDSK